MFTWLGPKRIQLLLSNFLIILFLFLFKLMRRVNNFFDFQVFALSQTVQANVISIELYSKFEFFFV